MPTVNEFVRPQLIQRLIEIIKATRLHENSEITLSLFVLRKS